MHEIVVLSGKGGTGKTSITASLAILAGTRAVVADCDVDAANLHLLLQPDFAQATDFYSGELAFVVQDHCQGCGLCAGICQFNALFPVNGHYRVSPLDCEGCAYCEKVCPNGAIRMLPRKSGSLYVSKTRAGHAMVHARLDAGADNSGKLVARVKEEAKSIALKTNALFVLVDGAPGIGCPVVSSLAGASYVILVTEPSLSGLHDLRRVHAVIRKFRINAGCIINKYDINQTITLEIKQFLADAGIVHLADLPYDSQFTQAMIEGKTIVETTSPLTTILKEIWEKVYRP